MSLDEALEKLELLLRDPDIANYELAKQLLKGNPQYTTNNLQFLVHSPRLRARLNISHACF